MVPKEVYDALRFLLTVLVDGKPLWVRQRCVELLEVLGEREKHPCSPLPEPPAKGVFSDLDRQLPFTKYPNMSLRMMPRDATSLQGQPK